MAFLLPSFCVCAEKIHLQLRWHHQFQFAGYYAALEQGYYRQAGLDVILHEGSPEKFSVSEVLQGHAQYGVANSELLLDRLRGAPLVALAAIFQHSPSVLLARKDAGILSPDDLIGKDVMLMDKAVDADFFAMLHNEGVSLAKIHVIPSSFNIQDLVDGKVVAFNSYLSNEPYYLKQHGVEYTVLNPRNYGVDFYSDILFTTEDEIKQHPDRVKAFRSATLEGWRYAMNHPQEIIDLLIGKYQVKKSRSHLEFEAEAMRSLILPELIEIGHINPGRLRHMAETFVKAGMIDNDRLLEGFVYDPDPAVDQKKLRQYVQISGGIALLTSILAMILYMANRSIKRESLLRMAAEAEIKKLAYRDTLTGLDNRLSFFILANQMVKLAHRENNKIAVLFIDLNDFKIINDQFGHKAGDEVLIYVGLTLRKLVRQSDIAARLGGDEFAILLSNIINREDIICSLRQIQQEISRPIIYQEQELRISACIGMAVYPDDGLDIDALLEIADSHMYQVKAENKYSSHTHTETI
ncbi:GGDEF domain-containing protein [Candidatus Methylobacter favarea]|nr:GGDEF domain-containing protein [Candidatus Methylobacter favarea]